MLLMTDIKWFYPESLPEAEKLLQQGYRPHAGGTFLIKTGLNVRGLFDLSSVSEIHGFSFDSDVITLGAGLTYRETADAVFSAAGDNILSSALSQAASTPLRNRISLGGSIYSAPKWSDLTGPLIVSDASIELSGENGEISVPDYLSDPQLRKICLVKNIRLNLSAVKGFYYRFTLTTFDYPFFTVSLSVRSRNSVKLCVTGMQSGSFILQGLKNEVKKALSDMPVFNDERGLSGLYLREMAIRESERLLEKAGG